MSYERRIAKLEQRVDLNACPLCGADVRVRPEWQQLAQEHLDDYLAHCISRSQAAAYLSEDVPELARALGVFVKPVGEHFCAGCGADRRSESELACAALARYLPHVGGNEAAARALLREDAPELYAALESATA